MSTANQHEQLLRLENVGVSYTRRRGLFRKSEFWALDDVSFTLHRGETLGILGKNGVGKSTLLRLLAGIIDPDRGVIHRYGNCLASLLSLQVGFVPQLTGRENAVLSGMLLGVRKQDMRSRMDEITEFSGLGDFIDQPIYSYSNGMLARLGFSIAFQADPDILLVDEVLGVGDAEFREKSSLAMRDKIRSNKTVVLVSHNQQIIRNLCDRVVWIDGGGERMVGETGPILEAYAGA